MRADLLYITSKRKRVVLVENKIGSGFTYRSDPKGQLVRQLEYLAAAQPKQKHLVLLSCEELLSAGWYVKELASALAQLAPKHRATGHVLYWSDVLEHLQR